MENSNNKERFYYSPIEAKVEIVPLVDVKMDNKLNLNDMELGNMTINNLLADPEVELHKKKDSVKIIKKNENLVITLEVQQRTGLNKTTLTHYEKSTSKEERRENIEKMYHEDKLTQAQIADIVGLTQPQVSAILKKNKK